MGVALQLMLCADPMRVGQRNIAMVLNEAWAKWAAALDDLAVASFAHDFSAVE